MKKTVVINGKEVIFNDEEFEVCQYGKGNNNYLHYIGNGENITNPEGNTTCFRMFYCCGHSSLDLRNFDTSGVTNMRQMFATCGFLTSLDLSNFNTSNVKDMEGMFGNCISLTSVDVSSFDTSNVRDMYGMFSGCLSLTTLDVSNFDTSNVVDMCEMFEDCYSLNNIKEIYEMLL